MSQLIAEIGDGDLIDQVPLEDGDLLGAGKMATRLHKNLLLGDANPIGAFFQIRLRQNTFRIWIPGGP